AELFVAHHRGSEDQIRRIFIPKLVTIREDQEPGRRLARRSDFSEADWRLVSELAGSPYRLLVVTQESGATYVGVAHAGIFRSWPRLRSWFDGEGEFLIGRAGIETAYREWEKAPENSKAEMLLMGLPLAQAEGWIAKRAEDVPASSRHFIVLSRRAAKR